MSLPLCTPDRNECIKTIEKEYEGCLPQCSGLWVTSYDNLGGCIFKFCIIYLLKLSYSNLYWAFKNKDEKIIKTVLELQRILQVSSIWRYRLKALEKILVF